MNTSVEIKVNANSPDTDESRAGFILKDMLSNSLPKSARGKIIVVCNATLFGQEVKDVDLICVGQLDDCTFDLLVTDKQSGERKKKKIIVQSFAISIELKRHSIEKVFFRGTDLYVTYRQKSGSETFHNVTEQVNKQKIAVRNFFVQAINQRPYISNSIWLSSISVQECNEFLHLPSGGVLLSNILPSVFSFEELMQLVSDQMPPRQCSEGLLMNSFSDVSIASLESVFNIFDINRKASGELTRKRIELISQKKGTILPVSGSCLTIYQGYAGTGKTISLLKTAFHLFDTEQARVLILTYNHALASDLRRTIAFMNIPDYYGSRSINILTSYKFFHLWLVNSEVLDNSSDYFPNYQNYLTTLHEYIVSGVLSKEDIFRMKNEYFADFNWDYVLVDEAQDWLDIERDILFELYGSDKIAIADGRDQLVRNKKRCDWSKPLQRKAHTEKVNVNLRQKNNLAVFVNSFAHINEMDYWYLKPSSEMLGGRIIISTKSYFEGNLHKELISDLTTSGNSNYDMLFLTPPQTQTCGRKGLAETFIQNSIPIWDGTEQDLRTEYSISIDNHRLFQYDSCRGLEAWTVVCLDFDDFIGYKELSYIEPLQIDELALESPQWLKRKNIFSWCMLPLTRAISNLVITIKDPQSPICGLLFELYQQSPDSIEWIS